MKYISTRDYRGDSGMISSAQAVKRGLAADGGLYLPCEIPKLADSELARLGKMSYADRAAYIMSLFFDDYDRDALLSDCRAVYSVERFAPAKNRMSTDVAPVYKLDENTYALELWHGPTSAFKDMALQIMPRLLTRALQMTGEARTAHILVATSGDTGKAALEGFANVRGTKITVFYPADGVSRMQRLQMTTTLGGNVSVVAVRGNFDDVQSGVKRIFGDSTLSDRADENGFFFTGANSVNWGRLAPQVVYYVSAYLDLASAGEISFGDKINVCVPTGNFGDILAAYIAREMGVPISRLICASNSNRVLADFLETGVYDKNREFHKTISPSMDILVSSNLERLLSMCGGSELTARLMDELNRNGRYTAPDSVMTKLRAVFSGYYATETETRDSIRTVFEKYGYLTDPHTAVGMSCAEKYRLETGDDTPLLLVSTASPYKFAPAVCDALDISAPDTTDLRALLDRLSAYTNTEIPSPLIAPLSLPVRFSEVTDPARMSEFIFRA